MENIMFLRLEIVTFFLSFGYIVYYIGQKVWGVYFAMKNIINPLSIEEKKSSLNKVNLSKKGDLHIEEYKKIKLSAENKLILENMIKRVNEHILKGYFDAARHLIIEGLTIDKYNKDLNVFLAFIYEKEDNFKHAKYIYKDLSIIYTSDVEILKKLGYVYILEGNFEKSIIIYEKAFKKKPDDEELILILSDINYEIENYKRALKYVNLYLRNNPRNFDKLLQKAHCLENIGNKIEALDVFKTLEELHPYDGTVKLKIKELQPYSTK